MWDIVSRSANVSSCMRFPVLILDAMMEGDATGRRGAVKLMTGSVVTGCTLEQAAETMTEVAAVIISSTSGSTSSGSTGAAATPGVNALFP